MSTPTPQAVAFPLTAVRLLPGPLKAAQDRDAKWLLSLKADRLLANFRKDAGLKPKAPHYGGWESQGISGHSLGHYLSACAQMYAATGDTRFQEQAGYMVRELKACQVARGDGRLTAFPEADRIFGELARGEIRSQGFDLNGSWVPWYTVHKLLAGLLDVDEYCPPAGRGLGGRMGTGGREALAVAVTLADWVGEVTKGLNDSQWQRMLACEHGGINESLAELSQRTGQEKYLDLARKFDHKAILDPLGRGEGGILAGKHGNTQIPKIIGAARLYELTGEPRWKTISETFWNTVVHEHTYCMGGHGQSEYFGAPRKLSDRLQANTCETCNTYNMLKLTTHLFAWQPKAEYADFIERAQWNHILASQDPRTGGVCYFVSLQSGGTKAFQSLDQDFTCCVGTGMENHARYGAGAYYHSNDSLWVNLYFASEVQWKEKGVVLRQETRFPEESRTTLTLACQQPTPLTLRLRKPWWVKGALSVTVNGKTTRLTPEADGYIALNRTWKTGDKVVVALPMALYTEPMPDNPKRVAALYGPLVLAGDVGDARKPVPSRIPVFLTEGKPLESALKPTARPLTFESKPAFAQPMPVAFSPFYAVHDRRYSVYFDLFTKDEWKAREAQYRAEEAERKALEARTADVLSIGEMQPERDHQLQGQNTSAGDFAGRKWRHATDGGWFSFVFKTAGDVPQELVLTYWGEDGNNRTFDILIEGAVIATQTLDRNQPGKFFDVAYPVPPELLKGKKTITVKLQAKPGKWAGGLFGARLVKKGT